jgi:hypothetical protein
MLSLGIVLGGLLFVAALGLGGAIAFGGPTAPPPLVSIRDAILKRNRTDYPSPQFSRPEITPCWHIASIQRLSERPGAPL